MKSLAMLSMLIAMMGCAAVAAPADASAIKAGKNPKHGYVMEARSRAEHEEIVNAAQNVLSMIDRGSHEEVWRASAPLLRNDMDYDEFSRQLDSMREAMDPREYRTMWSSGFFKGDLDGFPPGHYAKVYFCAKTAERMILLEVVLVSDAGSPWSMTAVEASEVLEATDDAADGKDDENVICPRL